MGEITEKQFGGGTPTTSNALFWEGNIPWIQSSDLEEGIFSVGPRKYITKAGLGNSSAQLIPKNSIAIVTRVGVGKLAFMPFTYTTSQDFLSISYLKTNELFTTYSLYIKLQNEIKVLQGTSIKGITKNELLIKEIPIPSLPEQEAIGTFFSTLDQHITLHQRKLDTLKEQKMTYLKLLFPAKGQTKPALRFQGFEDDWEEVKLGEVLEERNVQQLPQEDTPLVSFTVENGVTPKTDRYDREFLVRTGDKKYKYTELDDIVYNPANLKFGAISRNKFGKAVFSPIYVTLVVNKSKVFANFIEGIVTKRDFIQEALQFQEGTVYERMAVKVSDFLL
ncbi:TPA: restriction endonuclease subunit S, partial [Streptococcus suis]|nr:restriction endonuclease subunit S [Streptococcus suis]